MKQEDFVKAVVKQVHFYYDRPQIEQELTDHLQDSIADLMEEGLCLQEAEKQAVLQMGNPEEIGKQLNREHHPVLGYLWLASTVIAILMIAPAFSLMLSIANGLWDTLTPTVVRNCSEKIPIELVVELPTEKVHLDYFCLMEDGSVYVTYRAVTNWEYSYGGWSVTPFVIENEEGDCSVGGYSSGNFFGQTGAYSIEWKDAETIILRFKDGQRIELNLKEYGI